VPLACGFGHNIKAINQAIAKQSETLDFSPTFQFGHRGAFELAERITQFMPAGLDRVFFCGSGSEAADTALKIARGYWRAKGQAGKTRLIGRAKGYHGVNFGGISVGGIGGNKASFGEGIASDHLRHTWLAENAFTPGIPDKGAERADDLLDLIALHDASNIAAVIVEPLAGSAGVFPPPVGYLKRLREICDQHDILLIFDEVITGFGRCGAMTGSAAFGVKPDMINLAKQLTNGTVPMGAVVAKREIYDTFMAVDTPEYMVEFPHGYTYSGIPSAVAAALAVQDIFEKENIFSKVKEISPYFQEALHSLRDLECVENIRGYGLLGGVDIKKKDKPGKAGFQVYKACYENGVNLKATGDALVLAPPFISEKKHIDEIFDKIRKGINQYMKQ
jgi:beta-alanine--pyruvate transaminase